MPSKPSNARIRTTYRVSTDSLIPHFIPCFFWFHLPLLLFIFFIFLYIFFSEFALFLYIYFFSELTFFSFSSCLKITSNKIKCLIWGEISCLGTNNKKFKLLTKIRISLNLNKAYINLKTKEYTKILNLFLLKLQERKWKREMPSMAYSSCLFILIS